MPEISGMIQQFLEGNIKTLSGPEPVIESKTITENGTYTAPEGVDGYSPVVVNVPSDEPVIESKTITENGTYTAPEGVDGYSPVVVNVPSDEPVIESKTITENGTYTPESGVDGFAPVVVNVPLPQNTYLLKSVNTPTPIASFNDGQEMVMPSLKVAIEPVQDLHGYAYPWVGGAGKNKAKPYSYTVTAPNRVTFTYNGDGSVTLNGTATASQAVPSVSVAVQNDLTFTLGSGTWIPSVSANNVTYEVYDTATSTLLSNGASFTLTEAKTVLFRVGAVNGQTYNNLKVYMQIESGSTATSYAPYSNICPISGWSEENVTVADDVETPTVSNVYTIDLDGTRYGGTLDVVNGIVTPAPYYASYNGEALTGEWISDRDKYEVGTTPTIGAQVVNIGASGTPVSILPTAIKSILGQNNVYANTGDIKDVEYFSKEV